jgi:hypothetical protein
VAHTYNPSYSGGRDREDCGSKPAWGNCLWEPISERSITKIGLVEWIKMKVLSSSPTSAKKKKYTNEHIYTENIKDLKVY